MLCCDTAHISIAIPVLTILTTKSARSPRSAVLYLLGFELTTSPHHLSNYHVRGRSLGSTATDEKIQLLLARLSWMPHTAALLHP